MYFILLNWMCLYTAAWVVREVNQSMPHDHQHTFKQMAEKNNGEVRDNMIGSLLLKTT